MIVKIFEEKGLKARSFARFVMGVLIVEDLVAVLLLVLLATMAVTQKFSGVELGLATLRLAFFLILWFVVGMFVLPGLVRTSRDHLSDETTLIVALGMCLAMVLMATQVGFSAELGAFVMGSLLAETGEGHRIEKVLEPLRNLFGAIFFVSVGMLFDPSVLKTYWPQILMLSGVVIIGKAFAGCLGGLLAGQNLRVALLSGLSLTQIGEFSFIIASLGMTMKVVNGAVYPMIVGVSMLTSFLTPFWLSRSESILSFVEQSLPKRLREGIERYQIFVQRFRENSIGVLRIFGPIVLINAVMIVALTWMFRVIFYPYLQAVLGQSLRSRVLGLVIDLTICLPFFWGLCFRRPARAWRERLYLHPRARLVQLSVVLVRGLVGVLLFLMIVGQYVSLRTFSWLSLVVLSLMGFLFYRYSGRWYRVLEARFIGQFERAGENPQNGPLLPWEAQLTELRVAPESMVCGKTIAQLRLQEEFGVMLAAISRGRLRILAPRGNESIFPNDQLFVVGSDTDVERLRNALEFTGSADTDRPELKLQSVTLDEKSEICGMTLRESQIRDRVDGLVVGFERDGSRQLNPPPDLRLLAGDRLWIVGDIEKIQILNG